MAQQNHVLTDVSRNIWLDEFSLSPGAGPTLAGSDRWSIQKRTLRGGVSCGVDVVEINNGALSVSILPTRGMGLWRGEFRGVALGWNSPVRHPVNPCFVNLVERSGLGWLSGFNELMCRCGLSWHGEPGVDVIQSNTGSKIETPLTLHGKIANTPAHMVSVEVDREGPGTLRVRGVVDESMLFGPFLRLSTTIETEAGSHRLSIADEITNLGGQPTEMEVLYHTNLGPPLLEEGSRLDAPIRELAPINAHAANGIAAWPTYQKPTPGYVEECYVMDLQADAQGETAVLLRNHAADKGFSLAFRRDELPCFTLWKNTRAEADGYVTGLEPGTSYPNLKTFERQQGRLITLGPGESYHTRITLAVHDTAESVSVMGERIAALQQQPPVVHPQPVAALSPAGR